MPGFKPDIQGRGKDNRTEERGDSAGVGKHANTAPQRHSEQTQKGSLKPIIRETQKMAASWQPGSYLLYS